MYHKVINVLSNLCGKYPLINDDQGRNTGFWDNKIMLTENEAETCENRKRKQRITGDRISDIIYVETYIFNCFTNSTLVNGSYF